MDFRELVYKSRTCRRFFNERKIEFRDLNYLVDLARVSPTGGNLQPLKFIISNNAECNTKIFNTLSWAAYLKEWKGPDENERPAAYIVILGDTNIRKGFETDSGIAAQTIILGAVEKGLGGCMFGSINRKQLQNELDIHSHLEIVLVIALGYPKETVVIDEIESSESIKYWRDSDGIHHVPKRKIEDIVFAAYE